ncbi:LytTR family DNA-binding domain-containing protein [Tamlana sp. 2201CG12-4]|uniref:LytTR family DNA-binding domain-containing protein n=1 Tax=Tamlana sp. 2201CG12-4 TaxID=3112582 RepID=UPI002DBA0A17|nr:LytTR family DNA-binding domain-containing protein [Tamlana sp. 2201CG12-4]MEC3906276.1 LytTR family DNA-binding domain-containing protein [Tamlana sp. 2201CG12-4]
MKIDTFLNLPFNFFDSNKNKWIYVIVSTIFPLIFLALFLPYGLSEEIENPVNPFINIVLFFLSIGLSTFIALSFSQFFARKLFGFEHVTIKKYMGWFLLEPLGLILVYFGFSFVIPDLGNDFEKELNIVFQIKNYFRATLILLFPFFGCIIYIVIKNLNDELKELGEQLKRYKSKFSKSQKTELLHIKDENDNLDLSLELKDFLFAESSNQYVLIHYLKEGRIKKHITRNRLKSFLNQTKNLPIKQCHRSYATNLLNVEHKVKSQGKDFLVISNTEHAKVPISKSYLDQINRELALKN